MPSREQLNAIASHYDRNILELRPGQYECIAELIDQKDVVAIIPLV